VTTQRSPACFERVFLSWQRLGKWERSSL